MLLEMKCKVMLRRNTGSRIIALLALFFLILIPREKPLDSILQDFTGSLLP